MAPRKPKTEPVSATVHAFKTVGNDDVERDYEEAAAAGDHGPAVERMAGVGMTAVEIGYILGLTGKDVAEQFAHELAAGQAKAKYKVSDALFKTATERGHKDHARAAMFWLQARAGWATTAPVQKDDDASDAPGGADATHLTDPEVRERFDETLKTFRVVSRK